MRDLLIILVVFVGCVVTLRRPWIGVMLWTWLSIMNLHRYTWYASTLPLAAAVAVATMLGLFFTRERQHPFQGAPIFALLAFMCWVTLTWAFALYPASSYGMWNKIMKIDFMILVAVMLLFTRRHMMALIWVLVVSIAFYGVKGGLFTLATGGSYRVWGPGGTFIEGNNELALALIVTIPLMRFLQTTLIKTWHRHAMTVAMILCAAAALGTQSRGALLALAAMAAVLWWRSHSKLVSGIIIGFVGLLLIGFMPEEWSARMNTIGEYEQDASAMGRINAWWMAWNLAKDRFLGGGFDIYRADIFARYAPVPDDVHAAHSIYFQVLGEHGFVGLFLFLLMWMLVWFSAGKIRRDAKKIPQAKWCGEFASMCQVSLVGFAVGGAFLSLAYFDLPYNLLVLIVLVRRWMTRKAWEQEEATEVVVSNKPPQVGQHV